MQKMRENIPFDFRKAAQISSPPSNCLEHATSDLSFKGFSDKLSRFGDDVAADIGKDARRLENGMGRTMLIPRKINKEKKHKSLALVYCC